MNFIQKILPLLLINLLFISACNSSTSDVKKVEIKKVSMTSEQATEENSSTQDKSENTTTDNHSDTANKLDENLSAPTFVEGKHYVELFPEMNTDVAPGKVEVIELMWLGCPHCYHLEPTISEYKKNLPDYVEFKQIPAMLNPVWSADANTYFIAEMLDPKGEKHLIGNIFKAIHEQRRRLNTPDAAKRFILQQGFSEEAYNNAKNSLAFQTMSKRAQEISAGSQADSVPALIINGKYRTSPSMAGGNENLIKIVNMLTAKEKK